MKSILKPIRNVLRTMRGAATNMFRKTVEIGGQLISVLVPGPATMSEPDFEAGTDEVGEQPTGPDYAFENAVYGAACELLGGGAPSTASAKALTKEHMRWLAAMPDEMLRKLLTAQPEAVRDHLKNERSIKGVLRYEKQAVDDYLDAIAREKAEGQEPGPELRSSWAIA